MNSRLSDGIVAFADDWGRHPSSCQHIFRRIVKRHPVLWVNTIGTRQVSFDSFTLSRGVEKIRKWTQGLQQHEDNLWVLDAPMLPNIHSKFSQRISRAIVTRLIRRSLRKMNISHPAILTTLPHTYWLVGNINQSHTVYYCTDDYSSWPGADRNALLEAERKLVSKASTVLVVSHLLEERLSKTAQNIEFFSHAVDYQHFSQAAKTDLPSPKVFDGISKPRVGFFGLIYEKLDFELLVKIATEIYPANLVLIGPVDYCDPKVARCKNIKLLGKVQYEDLPEWLSQLDVLILPYCAEDEMIKQSSPLKLRECLATGIPTVSVDVSEVRKYEPYVSVADSATAFINLVKEHLYRQDSEEDRKNRQKQVINETWEHRAEKLITILNV